MAGHAVKRRDPRPCTEDLIHESIVQLLRFRADARTIWFHPPNGIPASKRTGARFVRLGMLAGAPDLIVIPPSGKACFLEIKSPTGRLSIEQRAFQGRCISAGVPYAVARSSRDAEACLADWGALRKERQELGRLAA